ncbi:hypothetical protein AYY26_00010 [Photobacterium phosphoreum]|uniref:S-4TM family putative pore-forming effector n=1 Tax=Photobacterium phosphoreum TaxID=659 RepID=UPI0007F94B1E|nr:S-4TM family putative pore-forming effector [Photobacterium phosphoreum]OBU47443.1 hypothetical protein AYY26_00010 [Photobacterium phosphoreum]
MLSIVLNQQKDESIEAGAAFREAYSSTKLVKSILWGVTLLLAVLQLCAAVIDKTIFDLTTATVIALSLYVLLGSFGKNWMSNLQSLGCSIQRRHDYLTLGVGKKPNEFDLPISKVKRLSNKWLKKNSKQKRIELKTWWDNSLLDVSFPQARLICSIATFSWEVELRKKYQLFLIIILLSSLLVPFIISLLFKFDAYQILVLAMAPFTPFVSLVLEELLGNKSCLKNAEEIKRNSQDVWARVKEQTISDEQLMLETDLMMENWQTYRLTTLPIFDWLYRLTRKQMEDDMIVDTSSLVNMIKEIESLRDTI